MAAPLYTTSSGRLFHAGLIFIPLVGLPARGKTHIARSLERYLRWLGVKTRVFSLGDYRRKVLGGANVVPEDYFDADAKSPETIALRKKIKDGVEDQVWDFFSKQGGQVVIYDANNGDKASRKELYDKFEARGVHVIYLGESACTIQTLGNSLTPRRIHVRQGRHHRGKHPLRQAFLARLRPLGPGKGRRRLLETDQAAGGAVSGGNAR